MVVDTTDGNLIPVVLKWSRWNMVKYRGYWIELWKIRKIIISEYNCTLFMYYNSSNEWEKSIVCIIIETKVHIDQCKYRVITSLDELWLGITVWRGLNLKVVVPSILVWQPALLALSQWKDFDDSGFSSNDWLNEIPSNY